MTEQNMPDNYSQEWEEVWQLFDQEGKEALDLVEEMLIKAETEPDDHGQIAELFRAMHNFKGMARMMGLSVTESLAHRAEDLIALVRDDGVMLNSAMISLLLEALDRLRAILDHALAHRQDVETATIEELVERLAAIHEQYAAGALPAPAQPKTDLPDEPFFFEANEIPPSPDSAASLPATIELTDSAITEEIFVTTGETPPAGDGSLPAPDEAVFPLEAEIPLAVTERIDPAADPVFVQIFLELAKDEWERLRTGLKAVRSDYEAGREQIEAAADNLSHAANQMGYTRLAAILDEIMMVVASAPSDTQIVQLNQAELSLFEELKAIEVRAQAQHLVDQEIGLSLPEDKLPVERPLSPDAHATLPSACGSQNQDSRAEQTLDNLLSTIGELVAFQASLHRAADKLQANDLAETISRFIKQSNGNGEETQQRLQEGLKPWLDNLRVVAQIETEMSARLNRIHEMTLALRVRPAAEVLSILPLLAQEAASRQGKQVEIEVQGGEIELDRGVLGLLAQAAQSLVIFNIFASLEIPAERRMLHKTEKGRIWVALSKQENHVKLVVSDDGSGLIQTTHEQISQDELARWLHNGGVEVDRSNRLAPLMAELQARRGQLKLTNQPGKGLKFELSLPLDQVVMDSMVVRAGQVRYVVPINAIRRIVKPQAEAIIHSSADGKQSLLRLEDTLIPIQNLNGNGALNILSDQLLLVLEKNQQVIAFAIDELVGQQRILVRPLEGCLAQIQHAAGCAVLGEGEIGLVLNLH